MSRVAIIAALPGELKPLVKDWEQRGRNRWRGRVGTHDAVAVAEGMGKAAAERAVDWAMTEAAPDMLVSYGWAGALTCAVKPPAACVISEVVDATSGERFTTDSKDGYRLITLDRVAGGNEKRGLAHEFQSVLVDMEAAAVARYAAAQGIPFRCFKGVSDGYNDRLPDFNRFLDGKGQLRIAALAGHAAVRPVYWPALLRLGQNSGAAARDLAHLLTRSLAAR
jgi:adenosylhomocysteine nucleosidase